MLLSEETRLLCWDGRYLPVKELEGELELVTYVDGSYRPAPAKLTPVGIRNALFFKTGSSRSVTVGEHIEFWDDTDGWRNTRSMYIGQTTSAAEILKLNKIKVPRKVDVFGSRTVDEEWIEQVINAMLVGYQNVSMSIPDFFCEFDRDTLLSVLRPIFWIRYPNLRPSAKTFREESYKIKINLIREDSYPVMLHLLTRFGVCGYTRPRRNNEISIKDLPSYLLLGVFLDTVREIRVPIDTSITDWVWVYRILGPQPMYQLETDADNICDGLLIWRKSQLD
jgi:hypothetical protein